MTVLTCDGIPRLYLDPADSSKKGVRIFGTETPEFVKQIYRLVNQTIRIQLNGADPVYVNINSLARYALDIHLEKKENFDYLSHSIPQTERKKFFEQVRPYLINQIAREILDQKELFEDPIWVPLAFDKFLKSHDFSCLYTKGILYKIGYANKPSCNIYLAGTINAGTLSLAHVPLRYLYTLTKVQRLACSYKFRLRDLPQYLMYIWKMIISLITEPAARNYLFEFYRSGYRQIDIFQEASKAYEILSLPRPKTETFENIEELMKQQLDPDNWRFDYESIKKELVKNQCAYQKGNQTFFDSYEEGPNNNDTTVMQKIEEIIQTSSQKNSSLLVFVNCYRLDPLKKQLEKHNYTVSPIPTAPIPVADR